jgi:hypothetical protein
MMEQFMVRLRHAGYQDVTLLEDGDVVQFTSPFADGPSIVLVFRDGDTALAYVVVGGVGNHLNHGRGDDDQVWSGFWHCELENREAGRVTWMHGPTLPQTSEAPDDHESGASSVFDLFG